MEIQDESEIDMFLSQTSDEFSIDAFSSDEEISEQNFSTSSWFTNISRRENLEFNDSNVGPNHNLPEDASSLDYFGLFWDDELISLIVTETNRYA